LRFSHLSVSNSQTIMTIKARCGALIMAQNIHSCFLLRHTINMNAFEKFTTSCWVHCFNRTPNFHFSSKTITQIFYNNFIYSFGNGVNIGGFWASETLRNTAAAAPGVVVLPLSRMLLKKSAAAACCLAA
jgi:hypothetical protein